MFSQILCHLSRELLFLILFLKLKDFSAPPSLLKKNCFMVTYIYICGLDSYSSFIYVLFGGFFLGGGVTWKEEREIRIIQWNSLSSHKNVSTIERHWGQNPKNT